MSIDTSARPGLADGTYTSRDGDKAPKWVGTITITFPEDGLAATTNAQQIAALIEAGLYVDLTIPAGEIRANVVVNSPYYNTTDGHKNLKTKQTFKLIARKPAAVFTVTGTPSLTDNFVVTFTSTTAGATLASTDLDVTGARTLTFTDNGEGVWIALISPTPSAKRYLLV